ncbi:helix-turn-helix domain-containing protein [Muricauda sp. JGD-17]|uniref:Helix-turn-helix domain-containing protein n=1 Tax=Flagellimonas ochracea TaxID=2696472 RepID=A0A964TDV4_9FLAO|nr:helix-turn-helix domain-containing protein [Allomuricauda ochracea]
MGRFRRPIKKITSIAYEAGYSSVGNFSNAFYKRYGFRPSDLRK